MVIVDSYNTKKVKESLINRNYMKEEDYNDLVIRTKNSENIIMIGDFRYSRFSGITSFFDKTTSKLFLIKSLKDFKYISDISNISKNDSKIMYTLEDISCKNKYFNEIINNLNIFKENNIGIFINKLYFDFESKNEDIKNFELLMKTGIQIITTFSSQKFDKDVIDYFSKFNQKITLLHHTNKCIKDIIHLQNK